MGKKIEVEFEFEIGDLVFFRSSDHAVGIRPKTFCVYERLAQECHGGIQRLYKLGNVPESIPEVLLCKDEPEYRPMSDSEIEDQCRLTEKLSSVRANASWRDIVKRTDEKKKGE